MKMISSAKVRKNELELRSLYPFKNQLNSIMTHLLSAGEEYSSPLTEPREVKRAAIVVYGSDDGLCGAYNVNIFKYMLEQIKTLKEQHHALETINIIPVGKKMRKAVAKYAQTTSGVQLVLPSSGVDSKMTGERVNDFTLQLQQQFLNGEVDLIETIYMQFITVGRQRPRTDQLFPVDKEGLIASASEKSSTEQAQIMYIFEPDANTIFKQVLPMFTLSFMQEVTIENRASEQAARIMAMQAANDNAHKLLEELQLEYNKLRQQGITTELLDILGGQVDR